MLVTHDHWSLLENNLGIVMINDANGQSLVKIQLLQFKKLIRYRDGGTMIFQAPKEIALNGQINFSRQAGNRPKNQAPVSGDSVFLVYRQREGVEDIFLMEATVEKLGGKQGKPIIRLLSENGHSIVGGDSGGGVWFEGTFVANMWTTVMMEDMKTGARRQTDTSIAALFPGILNGTGDHDIETSAELIASLAP